MKAIWFVWLVLQFCASRAYLLESQISTWANRYVITKGECSTIQSNDNLLYSIKSAFDECATLCDEYAECQSFQWNANETLCQTYNSICLTHTPVNYTYSLSKMERTVPKVIFSSTYFLRLFGACGSNNPLLTNMTVSTIENCAIESAKYPRCQYVSFSNESQPNCKIGGKFCDNPNERIQRGNHQWQLLKRISYASFDYFASSQISIARYDGVPPNTSKIMAIAAMGEEDCVKKCIETLECVASVFSSTIKPLNCILANETFNPMKLLHAGETTWQTYVAANDYRDINLTLINGTEFVWQPNGDYSGKLLQIFNLSSLSNCATNCANNPDCIAFKFTNSILFVTGNCELHTNWHGKKTSMVNLYIRLSFPYEENGTKYIRHRYENGMNDNIVSREGTSFSDCESLCSSLAECTSFLYIHPHTNHFHFNCITKRYNPDYIWRGNIFRKLLLDGWNIFTYANDTINKTAQYENYVVHNGNCFDPARTTSKSVKVTQDECRLMCDELAECKGFVIKHGYTAVDSNCTLNYNKCANVTQPIELETESFEKNTNEESKFLFGQTYYIRWFGDCISTDNQLLKINVSSTAECAAECSKFARCDYFTWVSRLQTPDTNCIISNNFCFLSKDRTYRGDPNLRQMFQRINRESFDYLDNGVITMFNGICDTGVTSYNWTVPMVESAKQCGVECRKMNGCTAYSFTWSPSEWNWKYNNNNQTNCVMRDTMCDPSDLRRSEDPNWETYEIVADLSGLQRVVIGETEFINDTKGVNYGDLLHSYNTSNEDDCAGKCSQNAECEAFRYLPYSTTQYSCEIFTNISWSGTSRVGKFIRLSNPAQVVSRNAVRYKYECGYSLSFVISKDLVDCAKQCQQTVDCVAFLFTDSQKGYDPIFNCVPKSSFCTTNSTVIRLLLPGWNTYVFNNGSLNPAEKYIYLSNKSSSYTGDRNKLNDCARSCDDKPSCKGFDAKCELLYCQPTTDSECLSNLNESVFMKNNTGAQLVTWSNRQYFHWNADCRGAALRSSHAQNWQKCLRECLYEAKCLVAVYKPAENPNCYQHETSCQKLTADNPNWHLYREVSHGTDVAGQLFRQYNGECPNAQDLGYTDSDSKEACGRDCVEHQSCQAFVLGANGSEHSCTLRERSCQDEKMIFIEENSPLQFVRLNFTILGLRLNTAIDDTSGNNFYKYVLSEEDCYKKCESDILCLAMSYNRRGAETDELCQLYNELLQLTTVNGSVYGQRGFGWDTWFAPYLQVGFAKLKGLCKVYPTKLPGYTVMKCAERCAILPGCRDFAVVKDECWINVKPCQHDVQPNDKDMAYTRVLFKESYKVFEGGEFALSNELCSDRQLKKSVVKEAECAQLCVSLNENCSSFVWYSNNSSACFIQPQPCTCVNETRANLAIYKKLSFIVQVKLPINGNVSLTDVSEFQKHRVGYGIAIAVAMIFITGGFIILIVTIWRKFKQLTELTYLDRDLNNPSKEIDPILPVFDQLENLKLDEKFELPLDCIDVDRKTLKTLGMGNFGRVVLGKYTMSDGKSVSVAIKRTRSSWDAEQYRMLFKEICLMANIGKHPNLVNLVGAVTQIAKGHLYLVMDYCSNGSLRQFIIKSVEENQFHNEIVSNGSDESYATKPVETNQLCTSDLLSFAFQIASGMEYVASVKLVHRDLAARNVLLTSDLIAKISDFGLGRQEYQFYETDKTVLLPIRWTSPEALLLHKFSTRSDVWSFGVTLGEIFSLGTVPFANVSKFDRSFAQDLKEGRLIVPKPQFSPERVYKLITHCCMPDPKNRVSFAQCKELLLDEFRFGNVAKFEQLIEKLLVIQKSFPKVENVEISGDPAAPAIESPSKRPSFSFRKFSFLSQKPSTSQLDLEDMMLKEFKRDTVELNSYQ